jgi:hypothetical protein
MTIDPTVRGIAAHYNLDPRLVQAVVDAEGGNAAIVRAVQCSDTTVTTLEGAIRVVCRSAIHRAFEFLHTSGLDKAYVGFFGAKWAPVGVANDPTNLNKNWPTNVFAKWQA